MARNLRPVEMLSQMECGSKPTDVEPKRAEDGKGEDNNSRANDRKIKNYPPRIEEKLFVGSSSQSEAAPDGS